jgi:hypothetical protein
VRIRFLFIVTLRSVASAGSAESFESKLCGGAVRTLPRRYHGVRSGIRADPSVGAIDVDLRLALELHAEVGYVAGQAHVHESLAWLLRPVG